MAMLGNCRAEDWDLLVATDAKAAAAPSATIVATEKEGRPGFALARPGDSFTPGERLLLTARFGHGLVDLAGPPEKARRLRLATCYPPPDPAFVGEDAVDWRRGRLWRSKGRNGFLARVARAFGDRDENALAPLGLTPPAAPPGSTPRVAVLADCPEHARALRALLPGWAVRAADQLPEGGVGYEVPGKLILTIAAADRLEALGADVVINGTLAGLLELPALYKDVPGGAAGERLFVELLDDGDDRLRAATEARLRSYREVGLLEGAMPALLDGGEPRRDL
jgi:hypothetical protein